MFFQTRINVQLISARDPVFQLIEKRSHKFVIDSALQRNNSILPPLWTQKKKRWKEGLESKPDLSIHWLRNLFTSAMMLKTFLHILSVKKYILQQLKSIYIYISIYSQNIYIYTPHILVISVSLKRLKVVSHDRFTLL